MSVGVGDGAQYISRKRSRLHPRTSGMRSSGSKLSETDQGRRERVCSCHLFSFIVSYLHVTIELDVNGLAAVRCQEVRAVIGNNQVEEGVLLKQWQGDVEGLESKLWDVSQASVPLSIRTAESL
jgi:hypothetical protein